MDLIYVNLISYFDQLEIQELFHIGIKNLNLNILRLAVPDLKK